MNMHGLGSLDPGMNIDWEKTSIDYARYRPGPPKSFYGRLSLLGVGLQGQRILDLGTGTGVLARQFARQGCTVIGTDISAEQIKMAETLAKMDQLEVTFRVLPSEEISFETPFDAVTANQCFLYFKKDAVVPSIKRHLAAGGVFITSHFSWLPLADPVAKASEDLILKHNIATAELFQRFRIDSVMTSESEMPSFTTKGSSLPGKSGAAGFGHVEGSEPYCRQIRSKDSILNMMRC